MNKILKRVINKIRNTSGFSMLRVSDRVAYGNFYENPLGDASGVAAAYFRELGESAGSEYYPEISHYEQEAGFQLDPAWLNDLALTTQVVLKDEPLCYAHGRVLYVACELMSRNSSQAVELKN